MMKRDLPTGLIYGGMERNAKKAKAEVKAEEG